MTSRRPATSTTGETGRRSFLNGRAISLIALFLILIVTTAIPFKNYLDQSSRINDLQSAQDANEARIAELQNQVERWKDPAYVKAQARNRLHYVMPNEVGYIVLEADEAQAVVQNQTNEVGVRPVWYRTLWSSLHDAADTAPPLLEDVGGK
jgi:cell division protein FtsB